MRDIRRAELVTDEIKRAIQAHACECFPEESVGVISGGRYVPLRNDAARYGDDPTQMATPEQERFRNMMADRAVQAMIHSHAGGPFYPSGGDMQTQIDLDIPLGIVCCYQGTACSDIALWGDMLEMLPLEGRFFQHGIADCYEAIRDWYWDDRQYWGLPPVARPWDWWRNGQDLYSDYLATSGFVPIDPHDMVRGDAILFKMPTRDPDTDRLVAGHTYNHAVIYLSPDTCYHHPSSDEGYSPGNKSGMSSLSNRIKASPLYLRLEA